MPNPNPDPTQVPEEQKLYYVHDEGNGMVVTIAPPNMSNAQAIERTLTYFRNLISQAHAQGEREGRIAELMEFQDRTLHQAFSSSPMDYVKFHAENANYISDRLAQLQSDQEGGGDAKS